MDDTHLFCLTSAVDYSCEFARIAGFEFFASVYRIAECFQILRKDGGDRGQSTE
jgi:hypothetical protein